MSRDRLAEAAAVAGAFDPDELTLARKFRGLRKNELAQTVGVTPAALSQYELGQSRPSPAVLARLALALGVPVRFFVLGHPKPVTPSAAHFRSLRATTHLERDQALAFGQLAWRLVTAIEKYIELPASRIPHALLPAEPGGADVVAAARQARESMGIGAGPVPHVVRLLEAHGIVVIGLPAMSRRVDAFSHWYGSRPVVFLNPAKDDKARSRFDAAHELGHLVLHGEHQVPSERPAAEMEANRFAAAFLMPRASVLAAGLANAPVEQILRAKQGWNVAAMALTHRLHELDLLTDWGYRTACVQLSRLGYRRAEPRGIARESSQLLGKVFRSVRADGLTQAKIAAEIGIGPGELRGHVFGLTLTAVDGLARRVLRTARPVSRHFRAAFRAAVW